MKKRIVVLLIILALAFSLAACNSSDDPASPGNAGSSGDAGGGGSAGGSGDSGSSGGSGGSGTSGGSPVEITVSRDRVPSSLEPQDEDNPMATTATYLIFDRLVAFDNNTNEWLPQVATKWNQVDDTTWTFDINLDIKFHNGDTLTMDDVIFSFTRASQFPRSADNWNMVESVTADGNVLTMKFKNNFVTTPSKVLAQGFIVNKAYIEAGGDDAIFLNPIATGPYRVTEFTPLSSISMEAFDDYFGGRPSIDVYHFVGMPETDARYIALESGQIQYAGDLNRISYDMADADPNLTPVGNLSKSVTCVSFNCTRPPFDNVNVRRALVHSLNIEGYAAFDKEQTARSLLYGGYMDMYYEGAHYPEFDLQKAKDMLAAEGFDDSNPLKFELLCVSTRPGQEMWQADLKSIGVEMSITRPEFGTYISRETSSDYDVLTTGQGNRGNHPLTDLDRFSNDMFGSRNFCLYTSDHVQELINEIRVTKDEARRTALSHELEDILSQDVPMVGIYLDFLKGAGVKGLTGVVYDGWGRALFRGASFSG